MCKNKHIQIQLIPGRACGIKQVLNQFVQHFGGWYLLVEHRVLFTAWVLVGDSEVYISHCLQYFWKKYY